ncbi:MAG: Rrf2 family transcriptional regulator [Desulfomonile sp.]|nr:Rrf2 family transcriptional regulator [Desulfomonile sp.]
MRITTTSRYGVRAVFDVAYHGAGKPVQIKDVAKRQKISQRYLEQIFNKLLKKKILLSKRGPHGGYLLAREPSKITVKDIVEAAQGPIVPVQCLVANEALIKDQERYVTCVTRTVWAQTQKIIQDYFASVSVADLCALARKKGLAREVEQSYMYFI